MKTATARELKHELSAILDLVEHGESVCIKRHGNVIARLIPERKVSGLFIEKGSVLENGYKLGCIILA